MTPEAIEALSKIQRFKDEKWKAEVKFSGNNNEPIAYDLFIPYTHMSWNSFEILYFEVLNKRDKLEMLGMK